MGMIQLPKQFTPDFAVPGKKPVGPVEIDTSHASFPGLWLATTLDGTMQYPRKAISNLTGGSFGIYDGVPGVQFDRVADQGISLGEYVVGGPGFTGTAHTVLVVAKVIARSQRNVVVSHRQSGDFYGANFNCTASLAPSSGIFSLGGAGTTGDVYLSGAITDKLSAYSISKGVGVEYGSIDGQSFTPTVGTATSTAANPNDRGEINIGDLGNFTGTGYGSEDPIYFLCVWNRTLSQAEINSLTADPYQLLKPVNAPVYFPAAAAGGGITGTADFTLAGLTTTSSGDVDVIGTSDITLDALTTTSAGSIDVEGTSSITFDSLTVTGQGTVDVDGTSDITFDALTTTGQGFVGNPPAIGTADFTLAAMTTTSLGTVDVSGTSDNTFDALTTTTAGSVDVEGTSSNTFDGLSLSSSGAVAVEGTSSNTFADLTLTGQGTTATIALGTADFTFDGLTVTSVGDVAVEGASSANLDSLTTTTNATVSITGTSSNTLDALTVTASASGLSLPRIDGLFNQVINTDGGSVRMYFNGTDYFTL